MPGNPPIAQLFAAPRCGARTRSGRPCQGPAMPNGRCRMHGGPNRGAPGNQNALKHGAYTNEMKALRRLSNELRREASEIRKRIG